MMDGRGFIHGGGGGVHGWMRNKTNLHYTAGDEDARLYRR